MEALTAGMNQTGNGKLQFAVHGILIRHRHGIRLYQSKLKSSDVIVFDTFTIHRIEANPGTDLRFPVADGCTHIARMFPQRRNQFPGGPGEYTLCRYPSTFAVLPHIACDIAYKVIFLIQGFQISNQFLGGIPGIRCRILCKSISIIHDGIIPVHGRSFTVRCPTTISCHLHDGATLNGRIASAKGTPFPFTFTGMVSAVTPGPIVPNGAVITFCLQGHSYIDPVLI